MPNLKYKYNKLNLRKNELIIGNNSKAINLFEMEDKKILLMQQKRYLKYIK